MSSIEPVEFAWEHIPKNSNPMSGISASIAFPSHGEFSEQKDQSSVPTGEKAVEKLMCIAQGKTGRATVESSSEL